MSLSQPLRVLPKVGLTRFGTVPAVIQVNRVHRAYVHQGMEMPTGSKRISDMIKRDHRELEEYYQRIINSDSEDEQIRYQNQFIWELARHSIGEELVVYPKMEKLNGGKEMAAKDREQHQQIKEKLYEFQQLKPNDRLFVPMLKDLMNDLSQHVAEEEQNDLPRLEDHVGKNESEEMAHSFARTKHFVPTRSHPGAPDKPPFETVVGLMAAPIDKLMDLFRKFPKT